jgi:ribosomal biogenesis protein LAS1
MSLLARQIGLPAGLVGLRHEATHEDLPSLEILRDGVWKALEYLRVESLEPLVFSENGNTAGTSRSIARRAELTERLDVTFRKYKKVMKSYFRERTSKSVGSGGNELRVVLREVEDTMEKALAEEEADIVLDILTDSLLKPGCLIPLSIRYVCHISVSNALHQFSYRANQSQ